MKVSVVVATRNAGRTIERCLRSVRSQNYDDLEIVVVDNHSEDDTVAVASVLADVVVTAGPERSAQRNSGAFVASGDLLVFVDADMVLEPGVVRDAATVLDDPDAPAVVIPERSFGDGFWARCKALEKQLALNDPAVEAARAFRREDFLAVRGYDERLVACEDWDLADRITARSGGDPARTSSLIWHDEGRLRLRTTFQKKRYYGRWVSDWMRTAPEHRRRRSLRAGLPRLLRQPITATGLVAMKLVEAMGFLLGIADARHEGDRDTATHRETRAGVVAGSAIAAAVAAGIVQSWFHAGAFVSAGDNGPWTRGLRGVTRSWSDTLVGTGSTGYPSSSLVENFLHDVFSAVGISDTLGQRLWYTLVVAVGAASVAYLTAAFTRRGVAVAVAGMVAVLAPFHITTLPNVLPIIAIGALSLVLGVVARVAQGRTVPAAVAAPIAVWVSPLAKNPPLLALVAVIAVVAVVVAASRAGTTALRRLAPAAAWFGAASLFWAVPLVVHYALGTPGLTIVAETDVDAWSWTQRHSGPGNVLKLVASWVWGDPDILPATATLAKAPWSLLLWGLPIAAVLSVPLAANRRLAAWLAGIGTVLVVLCTGLNAPFGEINRFLLDHVPGFWLFRQPMSKFGVVLVVVYAVLVGLGVDGLVRRRPSWTTVQRRAGNAAAVLLAVAVAAVAHPLYTGTVIPGQRGGHDALPSARVTVPESWYEAGRWLDEAPLPGSVMVLPLSEYYQRGTTWGYYGVDDLMWRITERRSLYLLPGGYYESAGTSPALMTALQDAVARGDGVGTSRLMEALGVSYLAVRTDYASTAGRRFADSHELIAAARRNASLHEERDFEHVRIFSSAADPAATTSLVDVAPGTPDERIADIVAAAPAGVQVVDDDGLDGDAVAWRPDGDAVHEFPNAAGDHLVSARPRSAPVWQARTERRAGSTVVVVELASTLAVDDVPVTTAPVTELTSTTAPVALLVGGRVVQLGEKPVRFEAEGGEPIQLLGDGPTTRTDPTSAAGNCNNVRKETIDEAGITALYDDQRVTLVATSGSACLAIPAPVTAATATTATATTDRPIWHVRAHFERTAGRSTRVCLWLPEETACAVGTPGGTADTMGTFDFVAAPARGEDPRDAQLVLYADHLDGVDRVPVVTRYSDVSVAAITPVGDATALPTVETSSEVRNLAAGATAFAANPELTGSLLDAFGTEVADCHDFDDGDTGIDGRLLPDEPGPALELRARRHSACVNARVDIPRGIRHVTIELDHRNVSGRAGRWCLIGPDGRCAASGTLPSSSTWRTFHRDIELAAADGFERDTDGGYRLYLYADGAGPGVVPGDETVVDYRDVAVRITYPMVAVAQPLREPTGDARSLTDRTTDVDDVSVIRLDEAYADEWTLDGLPEGATARHVRSDGWANAWIVDGLDGRSATVTARYGPDRLVSLAVWSIAAVLAAASASLVVAARRRRRPTTPFVERTP